MGLRVISLYFGDSEVRYLNGGAFASMSVVGISRAFVADLRLTRHHISLPSIMAYDLYPLQTIESRKRFYELAIPGDWLVKPAEWLIGRMKPIAAHAQEEKNSQPRAHGDVLCLHDGDYARPNADRTHTLAALEYWLPRWRDVGLEFVTIGQSLGKAVEG